jgi:hypothetical protein
MAGEPRHVYDSITPQPVMEGAGVRLKRSIGGFQLDYFDPFLLLDHFGSNDPADYLAGFPWHPHRGIETVTYMLAGEVDHRDSIGNAGRIGAGDVQWMTAGGGIMHEEMPRRGPDGTIYGFQLWVNLPAALKMSAPRYQEVTADSIPVTEKDGCRVRVVAGDVAGVRGPVTGIAASPLYLGVSMQAGASFDLPIPEGHTALAYVFEGQGAFGGQEVGAVRLAVFGEGDRVEVRSGAPGVRFMLMAGEPIREPVVPYGPFVMNTRQEIQQALQDLRDGTFVKP